MCVGVCVCEGGGGRGVLWIFSGTTHSLVIAPNLEPTSKVAVGNLGTRLVVSKTHISLRFSSPLKASAGKFFISRELFLRSLKTIKKRLVTHSVNL